MMVASSLYTLSSHGLLQVSFRGAGNPLSHSTNHHHYHHLHVALPHCLKLPHYLLYVVPHAPIEERAMHIYS